MSDQHISVESGTSPRDCQRDVDDEPSQPSTPMRNNQNPKHSKFLSSSSVKRRRYKPVHCHFCARFKCTRSQLEEHFLQSELCLSLYMREMHVNSFDGVMLKLFNCLDKF